MNWRSACSVPLENCGVLLLGPRDFCGSNAEDVGSLENILSSGTASRSCLQTVQFACWPLWVGDPRFGRTWYLEVEGLIQNSQELLEVEDCGLCIGE